MKSELTQTQNVAHRLRSLGYPLVQTNFRIPTAKRQRGDVLAWAAADNGELVPYLVVEVKAGGQRPEVALPQLAHISSALGTQEHFVAVDEEWFRSGTGFRTIEKLDGPPEAPRRANGEVRSVTLASQLLRAKLGQLSDRNRSRNGLRVDAFAGAVAAAPGHPSAIETADGTVVPVVPAVLMQARREVYSDVAETMHEMGLSASPPVIAQAIALLAGDRLEGRAVDPFCGAGNFLWALHERADAEQLTIETYGIDRQPDIIQAAKLLGLSENQKAYFEVGNAYSDSIPDADLVVAAPPMGMRLDEPFELLDGNVTKDGDIASVDRCLRLLKPGGRAVIQLSPSITLQPRYEAYRNYLANEYRVAALIGCPAGSAYATRISTVLLVLDRAPAGETFVAQLADDWRTQLAPEGPVMSAALKHIDGKP
jgi:SAM-dependent methyltransferase